MVVEAGYQQALAVIRRFEGEPVRTSPAECRVDGFVAIVEPMTQPSSG